MKKVIFLSIACIYSASAISQNNFGYGLKLPTEEQIKSVPYSPGFSLPASIVLPFIVDLSDKMPPIGNQGSQSSCTAWAVAYSTKSYQEKRQNNWLFIEKGNIRNDRICSPSFIFNTAKGNNQNYDCSTGIMFWEAFEILRTMGTSFLSTFPYNEQDCNTQPNSNVIQSATVNRISTHKWVNPRNLDEVKYNLSVGNPIIIGFNNCDHFQQDGFEANRRGINYRYVPRALINPKNYHAMVCVGYNDLTQTFKIMNSWTEKWGNSGYFDLPYIVFLNKEFVPEAYIINDAWASGAFVSIAAKENENTKSFKSNSLYSSWFKEGYYREYKSLRLGLTSLNQIDSSATVIFTDIKKNAVVNTITYKINTPQTFYYDDKRITFTFIDIAKAGRNPLTKVAYFELSIDNSIDNETKERIDRINILIDQKILYDKWILNQNQFLEKIK